MGVLASLLLSLIASAVEEPPVPPGEPLLDVVWPTPNPAFPRGEALAEWIQPTVSGRLESGLFGCVRNDGNRFHEGVDLKALGRDSQREATDPVYAMFAGRVVHINEVAGHSSYGRYVVLEHTGLHPAVYTLYAHLRRVADLEVGEEVEAGAMVGIMGRSAGGYTIPRERAHLHFEIGLRLTDSFQDWFDGREFGSKNRHGVWNGMNLLGFDPIDFSRALMTGRVTGPGDYLQDLPEAYSLRIFTAEIPDFVKRYPQLIVGPLVNEEIVAWEVDFTWFNLPFRWVPRYAGSGLDGEPGAIQLLAFDRELIEAHRCRDSLAFDGEKISLDSGLRTTLELLFPIYRR